MLQFSRSIHNAIKRPTCNGIIQQQILLSSASATQGAHTITKFFCSSPSTSNNDHIAHNHFGWPSVDGEDTKFRATTICSILKDGKLAVVGDGQVSMGPTIAKPNAKKVRRVTSGKSEILVGFAGGTADAMSLLDRLEKKLDQYPGQLTRACVELAKDWRTEKYLRHLQATMIVADTENSYTLTGNGDVFDSADGIIAIGSGGPYALAAARALIDRDDMDAEQIAKRALEIAAEICVYTNDNFVVETLNASSNSNDCNNNNTSK